MQLNISYFYKTNCFLSMKTLRRILVIFLCIVLAVVSTGFFLPGKVNVERSMVISASSEILFEQINTLKHWIKWTPWLKSDTSVILNYSGPAKGSGASLNWNSIDKNIGKGSAAIVSSTPNDSIVVILDFGEKGKTSSTFHFNKVTGGTLVSWSLDSDIGLNPVSRWVGLFIDRMVGPDMESGLMNLETLVKTNKTVNGFEIIDIEVPARVLLTVRDTASVTTISQKLPLMYEKISRYIKTEGISPASAPLTIYHSYKSDIYDIETCIPIQSAIQTNEGINCIEMEPQKAVMVRYFGTHSLITTAYSALQIYLNNNGIAASGPAWEEYVTNPNLETDSNSRQTNIYLPVEK